MIKIGVPQILSVLKSAEGKKLSNELGLTNVRVESQYVHPVQECLKIKLKLTATTTGPINDSSPSVTCSIEQFPGCCGIDIIHHMATTYSGRRKGLATMLEYLIVKAYENIANGPPIMGPGILMAATSKEENPGAAEFLTKMGWKKFGKSFHNYNTKHLVQLWMKKI